MRFILTIVIIFICFTTGFGQNMFTAVVKDAETQETLPGTSAVVLGTSIGGTANEAGVIQISNVPSGQQRIQFSFVGFQSVIIDVIIPDDLDKTFEISLQPVEEALEEVVITSTRSSRTIADLPTRVEFIAGEELDEKANMKPGDIRLVLSESTGIQVQQTSATSGNASIRIQGLDGRYTQILKDGFPLYAGFSGGLGLLQTPPLDLKQVEVIKGSSSTLYGGGAIAGLVNLVSRTPTAARDLRFLINGTSAKGMDLSGFYSQKFGKAGVTFFASRNTTEPYDPADIGLTAIPEAKRYTVNPKLFLQLNERVNIDVGFNFMTEDRMGGDIKFIEGNGDATNVYFERNKSLRYSTQFSFSYKVGEHSKISFKNSINHFDRLIEVPAYTFDGIQNSTFSELNYVTANGSSEWSGGLNLWTDNFSEKQLTADPVRDYSQTTWGAFIQHNFDFSNSVSLETGLRGDYVIDYGFLLLPRISLLYKISPALTSRIGGGFGYKTPTIFTEDSERIQFQHVLPISSDKNSLEKSYGANWDLNYRTALGDDVALSINHLFFYTYLDNPLMLSGALESTYQFVNLKGFTDSRGTETNVKVEFGDFKLFVGYTFTDTRIHNDGKSVQNPLTAKHRFNNILMYEVEEKWKIGLEAYYFGRQRLTDNTYGKEYWICGVMVEKLWEKFSLFINFENFLDTRQTRFDKVYTGTISNPVFTDIYAPVDGFVINGGVKLDIW
ncbi:MAG TPA: TonB-dependent receptor [Ohtaekwangia sp.]|nr:TonB-dependent receptor [Ohtaekwangia sp.]